MPTDLLYPEEIDTRLNWPPGRAARLARRRALPHYVLPDGSLRLKWDEVASCVCHLPAVAVPRTDEVREEAAGVG